MKSKETYEEGMVITKDGNQWCAVGPDFINLQESPAGFGDTQKEAKINLMILVDMNNSLATHKYEKPFG